MTTIILQMGISKIIILDLWIALLDGGLARSGSRDAFYYKKSKSLIKKQMKQWNIFQKAFWLYSPELTHTSKYRNIFYAIRILNIFLVMLYLLLFALNRNYSIDEIVASVIIIRALLINGILLVLSIHSSLKGPAKGNPKGWNFD